MDPKTVLIPSLILAFFSLYMVIGKLTLMIKTQLIKARGIKVKGIVERVYKEEEDDEITATYLEVHYTADNGRTYSIKSGTGTIFNKRLEGAEVDVYYKKSDPQKAFIVRDINTSLFIMLPFFIILLCIGLYLAWECLGIMERGY